MTKGRAPQYIRDRRSQRSPAPQSPPKRWWKVPLEIFLGFCAVVSLLAAGVTFLPKLSVDTSGSLRSRDPMGTVFYISNDGLLPLYDITVDCGIYDVQAPRITFHGNFAVRFPDSHADVLHPGHKMTTPCAHAVNVQATSARIAIIVDYRPPWVWWHRREQFPLEAERSEDGTWIWKNIPR